jgi:hypothetical protein
VTTNEVDGYTTSRLASIEQRLGNAASRLGGEHPRAADTVRSALHGLRERLAHAHADTHHADDVAWARYSADLDRGIDELSVEMTRVMEQPGGGSGVEDVLYIRATSLELDGWSLRLDVPEHGTESDVRTLVATAKRELSEYRAAVSSGQRASRDGVQRAMDELRRTAGPGVTGLPPTP